MLEVVGTIINENKALVGLVLEGKPKDFGEIGGNEKVRKALTLDVAKKMLHNCKNFNIKSGKIMALGKDKLSDLKMFSTDGVELNSGIALVSKITSNDTIIGFDVRTEFNGQVGRYRYQDVVTLSGWFKPLNFIVKYTENGKAFISGKPGVMKLDNLPEVQTIAQSKRSANNKDRAVKSPAVNRRTGVIDTNRTDNVLANYLDIFTILEAVRKANGIIIYLNDVEYKSTTDKKVEVGSAFYDLGAGLVGEPYPDHSADKMKVNIPFKKPGLVNLPNGMRVCAYTYNTRTIIKNGENHIKSMAIAVSANMVDSLIDYFSRCGGELHISPITDEKFIKVIEGVSGNKNLKYFKLDLSKIDVLSTRRANESVLTHEQIASYAKAVAYNGLLVKGLKAAVKNYTPAGAKDTPCAMYQGFQPEMLDAMTNAGIDITTGAYTKTEAKKEEDTIKGEDAAATPVSIKYEIKGYSASNVTAKDMLAGNDKALKSEVYQEIVKTCGNINDMVAGGKVDGAKATLKDAERKFEAAKSALWMHKAAMLHLTDYKAIHVVDADKWEEVPTRAAKAKKYVSKIVPNLFMTVEGVKVGK